MRNGLHRLRALPARGVLAGAAAVALLGTAAAVAAQPAPPVAVSTGAGVEHPSRSAAPTTGADPTSTSSSAATSAPSTDVAATPSRPRSGSSKPSAASVTATTKAPSRKTTSTTVWDWKAAGYPGPPGTVVNPWNEVPYVRSNADLPAYSTLTVSAPKDGAVPGTTMPLTVEASWGPQVAGGTVVLRGPMHNNRPPEQEATRVIDSWTGGTCSIFQPAATTRTTKVDLAMRPVVLPEYTLNGLVYEVWATATTCTGETVPTVGYVQLLFNVAEPWVVQAPGPGLMSTG